MDNWITALEISKVVKKSRRNVSLRANRENWPKRKRRDRGGGFEYLVSQLPEDIQFSVMAYQSAKKHENVTTSVVSRKSSPSKEYGLIEYHQLQGDAKQRADARLDVCLAYKNYIKPYLLKRKKTEGEKAFVADYNANLLDLTTSTRHSIHKLSQTSLRRWLKTLSDKGAGALAGSYHPTNNYIIESNSDLKSLCEGVLWHQPDIQATNLREIIKAQVILNNINADLPSLSAVRRWIKAFQEKNELVLHQLRNPDDFKNKRQVAWGRADENIHSINQLWELDSTPSDVMLIDGRHSIIGAIDVYSRRPIVIIHPTSSAEAICILLRKAILKFGVPNAVKTDNGKDYTSLRVKSVLDATDITHFITKPFAGDEKPYIERFFRTWAHGISVLLPGYAGHNVAKRKELISRKSFADQIMASKKETANDGTIRVSKGADVDVSMTSKELQSLIDTWIDQHYMHKVHRKLGCSPFKQWQSKHTTIRQLSNERTLDILLSPVPASSGRAAGVRTANKDAGIVIESISYFAPELGSHIGKTLYCSWDQHDVGQIYVFERYSMAFICIAKNPELSGQNISLQSLSKEARRRQNQVIAEKKKELRSAARKVSIGDVARDILTASTQTNSTLIGLPHQQAEYTNRTLQNVSQATDITLTTTRLDKSDFEQRRQQQIDLDNTIKAQDAKPRFNSQIEEFTYYMRQKDIRPLTADEIAAMERFRKQQPKAAKMAESLKTNATVLKRSTPN